MIARHPVFGVVSGHADMRGACYRYANRLGRWVSVARPWCPDPGLHDDVRVRAAEQGVAA